MSHDRKGNLTQNKDGSLYTWDFDNQLSYSTAGTPSVNAAYAYDALGRRVSKSSGNTITVFVHSNYQIATEYKSVNGGAFTEHQSFVYATYIDDPIALISTNGTYFYHSNQQYSISAITDSNGNLSERYGYNAYGKPVVITDSILVDNPYFFTGRQLDTETGLFYFRARYYDASLGQFISRDPLNYVDGMNLFRGYFAINGLDETGLFFSTVLNFVIKKIPNIIGFGIVSAAIGSMSLCATPGTSRTACIACCIAASAAGMAGVALGMAASFAGCSVLVSPLLATGCLAALGIAVPTYSALNLASHSANCLNNCPPEQLPPRPKNEPVADEQEAEERKKRIREEIRRREAEQPPVDPNEPSPGDLYKESIDSENGNRINYINPCP